MTNSENKSCYMRYTTAGERRVCNALLKAIIGCGYVVSVNDGEEYTLKQSNNLTDIKNAIATSGEDYLKVRTCKGGVTVGGFYLIWDNGDDTPIVDYTANAECERLYNLSGQD